jgi:hypothetical protein
MTDDGPVARLTGYPAVVMRPPFRHKSVAIRPLPTVRSHLWARSASPTASSRNRRRRAFPTGTPFSLSVSCLMFFVDLMLEMQRGPKVDAGARVARRAAHSRPVIPVRPSLAVHDAASQGRAAVSGTQFEQSPVGSPRRAHLEPHGLHPVDERMAQLPGRATGSGSP